MPDLSRAQGSPHATGGSAQACTASFQTGPRLVPEPLAGADRRAAPTMHPMPQGPGLPIRALLARLVIVGLLPVALIGAWSVFNTVRDKNRATERSILELSRALATAVDSELDATRQSLAAMGRSQALISGDLAAFYGEAGKEVAAHPGWSGIVLTDSRGQVLFKTVLPYGAADSRVIDPDSLRRAIATGAPAVGRLLTGQRRAAAFPVRVPVFVRGQLAYVLTAAVAPDRMVQVLRRQRAPQGWVIAVFDNAGVRVARSRDHVVTVGGGAAPELARVLQQPGEQGVGVSLTLEGEEVHTAFTRLSPDDWIVAVGAPTADAKRALARSVAWYVAGILGSLLACYLLARRIARRIAQGVGRIRDEAVQLSEGAVVTAVPSDIAELDEVAQALGAASQRLAENARIAREALAAADSAAKAKDEFLAVLGHELRNPLAPMLTALQLVDMKVGDVALRERRIMRRQLDHMRRLVDDLLDVSRITRGKFEIRRLAVSLRAVVERSLETVEPAQSGRAHPIEVTLPGGPVWVLGDETRLVQVVSNLLSNALRYGGDGRIRVTLEEVGTRALLRVADEGVGMTPDTLQRIFEPFFQAPQSTARVVGGLGLGLAIVRSIVLLHGGQVAAGSAGPGLGSWFTIELPMAPAPDERPDATIAQARRRTGKIAVVDDNLDALEMISEALRSAGHQVQAWSDPRQALIHIPAFEADVAILDLGMPELNGFELASALLDPATGWRGRLIALTGYGQQADRTRAQAAGFTLHLTKPVDVATLLAEVEGLVRPAAGAGASNATRPPAG